MMHKSTTEGASWKFSAGNRTNAKLAMEADKEILRTGKGASYVVEINTDGVQDFVQLIKEPVFDEAGNVTGIIALGNDVTEFELMKRKLAKYARIDELTGLGNRRAFNEFLEGVPSCDNFPIAVISADCDGLNRGRQARRMVSESTERGINLMCAVHSVKDCFFLLCQELKRMQLIFSYFLGSHHTRMASNTFRALHLKACS